MAFNTAAADNSASRNNFEKAAGFLNFYLPKADGGRHKIGAIPLKDSKAYDKAMLERLSADPESLEKMMDILVVDFQLATKEVTTADLPF